MEFCYSLCTTKRLTNKNRAQGKMTMFTYIGSKEHNLPTNVVISLNVTERCIPKGGRLVFFSSLRFSTGKYLTRCEWWNKKSRRFGKRRRTFFLKTLKFMSNFERNLFMEASVDLLFGRFTMNWIIAFISFSKFEEKNGLFIYSRWINTVRITIFLKKWTQTKSGFLLVLVFQRQSARALYCISIWMHVFPHRTIAVASICFYVKKTHILNYSLQATG